MFELDVSRDGGQTWTTEKSSQSLDTVKSAAKSLRPTGSWRIKWVRVNMRPRATQVPVPLLSPVR